MSKHYAGALNQNNNNKNNTNFSVRAVCSANRPVTYDISFQSIVEAYEDCLSNKRGSPDYLEFTINYQEELHALWDEIRYGEYTPMASRSFVIVWPVYREIFAAQFRDRIIHHWWALRINPLFESRHQQIGDVAMNCRKGHGQLVAIKAIQRMLDEHPDWWIGHFDIEAFFINIDKALLFEMLDIFIRDNYQGDDIDTVLFITRQLVFNAPQENAIKLGGDRLWSNVPARKSLFAKPSGKGCAIGNLPSQINANFLGSVLDYYVVHVKGHRNYLRFSDDIFMLLPTRAAYADLLPELKRFLNEQLLLNLHPKKIYIQPAHKGVLYVGAMILPGRTYISNRTRGRMYNKLYYYNRMAEDGKAEQYLEKFVQSMNSYLGMTVHHSAYNVRAKFAQRVSPIWWKYVYMSNGYKTFVIKKQFKPSEKLKSVVKSKKYREILTPDLL